MQSDMMDGDPSFRVHVPPNTTRIKQQLGGKNPKDSVCDGIPRIRTKTQKPRATDHGGAGSEDCFKVNIYAPASAKEGDKFPVLVHIRGGGYIYGNPRNWPFDHWVRQSPNVVIVSVYYRLDAFGFTTPDIADTQNGDFNAGFLDQIQALRCVKTHIESFGRDSSKVTINGESAGSGSFEHHLVANVKERLFSGAIAQSVIKLPRRRRNNSRWPLFENFASAAGCGVGDVRAKLAYLRKADVGTLVHAQEASFTGPFNTFHPVVDGKVLVGNPSTLVEQGKLAKVPLIVGATSNETVTGGSDVAVALKNSFPGLSDTDVQDILAVRQLSVPRTRPQKLSIRRCTLLGCSEADFTSSSQRFQVVTGEATLGGAYSTSPKSWTYRYDQPNSTQNTPAVNHAAENQMMFLGSNTDSNGTTTFTPQTPVELAFTEELIAYWLSFVRAGDPNKFKLPMSPEWPQYAWVSKRRIVLQQDRGNSTTRSGSFVEQEPGNESRRCEAIASKSEQEQD
ncbi:hypothetical protein PQX77_002997 [Marasmius sp. AFHP31]|nr:hypothetical protein PQX77_002997 [Marasmius sp. AFHP31]